MKSFLVLLLAGLLVISCGEDKDYTLVTRELNTAGVKHTVSYQNELPKSILYETFHGSGARDTTTIDSVVQRVQYLVNYDLDAGTALVHIMRDHSEPFRKYYFNHDNLLTKITRFDSKVEYVTDSVIYDYTTRTASFFDVVNKHVFELVYDNKNNIESETQKRIGDHHVYQVYYYYYDASRNPFLVNLDESEELFGCFNLRTAGLFWNNALRPVFSSKNNVQSYKEVNGSEERNGLFEYQYRFGVPVVQFGNKGVIYYRYAHFRVSQ